MEWQNPIEINRTFFEKVKESITVKQWKEEFPYLIYDDRTAPGGGRFSNLIGNKGRTTVLDLTFDEIVRIKDYLEWDYKTLLEDFKLGYNKLTRSQMDLLLRREGHTTSVIEFFGESMAA